VRISHFDRPPPHGLRTTRDEHVAKGGGPIARCRGFELARGKGHAQLRFLILRKSRGFEPDPLLLEQVKV